MPENRIARAGEVSTNPACSYSRRPGGPVANVAEEPRPTGRSGTCSAVFGDQPADAQREVGRLSSRGCTVAAMAIAHTPRTVLDCPDPGALAEFYAQLLGWRVDDDGDWAEALAPDGNRIAFQQVEGFAAPDWPGQQHPQQMHIDVSVSDLDVAETSVLAIGARKHEHQPGTSFRVFLDPAGHPFCLCQE